MIETAADEQPWRDVVGRLVCLRGVSTLTAFGLAVEIGDWQRFSGQTIGAYLGLTPSEDSTGQRRVLGSITKAGTAHARRLLVEAAWQQRPEYRPSQALIARRASHRSRSASAPTSPTAGSAATVAHSTRATSAPPSRPPRSRASSPATAGRSPRSAPDRSATRTGRARRAARGPLPMFPCR
jgi:transposase